MARLCARTEDSSYDRSSTQQVALRVVLGETGRSWWYRVAPFEFAFQARSPSHMAPIHRSCHRGGTFFDWVDEAANFPDLADRTTAVVWVFDEDCRTAVTRLLPSDERSTVCLKESAAMFVPFILECSAPRKLESLPLSRDQVRHAAGRGVKLMRDLFARVAEEIHLEGAGSSWT